MADTLPLISIAMPVFNTEKTMEKSIRSIINQTCKNWELMIVDDGSTDKTLSIARGFKDSRLRIFSDGLHKGLSERLNETIAISRGKFIARMDGDDVAYPQRLERQIMFLNTNAEIDLVGSFILVFKKDGFAIGKRNGMINHKSQWRMLFRSIPIPHPTFIGRKEWFEKNSYKIWPEHFQDQHLLMSALKSSKIALLPEILLGYREETLTIAKQWRYRSSYFKSGLNIVKEQALLRTIILLGFQLGKMAVDVLAIMTGLDYNLLRNRAKPLTNDEICKWELVWKSVNQPGKEREL